MKITPRQVLFFLAAVPPVGKLVLLPARLYALSGSDMLFPVLAQLAVQAGLIFCILLLARREMSFYRLLREAAGEVAARAAVYMLCLFLLLCAVLPVVEQKIAVRSIFYDTIPAHLVFTPFFLFSAYLCARPISMLGRIWDILAPLSLAGLAGIFLLSAGAADYGALSPAGAMGWAAFGHGLRGTCCWFCDAALLIPMLGKFPYRRGLAWKGALCYLAGGGVLLLLLATFCGVFGEISVIQSVAFARMSGFFAGLTVLGRIDYLFVFAVSFVMTFFTVLPMQEAVGMFAETFAERRRPLLGGLLSVGVNLAMPALVYALNFSTSRLVAQMTDTLFLLFPLCQAAFLLLAAAAALAARRRAR